MQAKVSVIIPVYKAERYIEKCVHSLFGQTLDSIEYIFVDDCSPDNSTYIIKKILDLYPNRKSQVNILRNEFNLGVGQSRQRGIDLASGEYLIHCDPDDWVDVELYESMYSKAKESNAEIVICDYKEVYEDYSKTIIQKLENSKNSIFHQLVSKSLHGALWNKLISSSLAKSIKIESGINLWEDLSLTSVLLLSANKIERVNKYFYYYNLQNLQSITHGNLEINAVSMINAVNSITTNLKRRQLIKYINILDFYKIEWEAKRGLLYNPTKDNIELWIQTFPNVNSNYVHLGLPLKSRVLAYLALHRFSRIIKLLNKLQKYTS